MLDPYAQGQKGFASNQKYFLYEAFKNISGRMSCGKD